MGGGGRSKMKNILMKNIGESEALSGDVVSLIE